MLSGGCALNVTANGRILQSGLFSEIIAPPAPHDAGCAVGAALARGGAARNARSPYLGPGFTDAEIARAFADRGLPAPRPVDEDALIAAIVEALAAGEIVGWFQGRAEFGPRALGSRSILADPRDDAIRETINAKIKKRELFRPFAPSTTIEAAPEFFELAQASPYMNILAEVRPEKRSAIPAVTHVDGTARVHTVSARRQPALSPPDQRLRRGDRGAGAAQHLVQHPGADREHARRGHRHLAALGHGPARHRRLPLRPDLAGGGRCGLKREVRGDGLAVLACSVRAY